VPDVAGLASAGAVRGGGALEDRSGVAEARMPAAAHQCILVPDCVRRRMLRRSAEGATRVTMGEIKALGLYRRMGQAPDYLI